MNMDGIVIVSLDLRGKMGKLLFLFFLIILLHTIHAWYACINDIGIKECIKGLANG